MIDREGVVKVVDFGLSVDQDHYLNTMHHPKGTPLMMAPEVWEGQPSDQRTDIYALAVSLWLACTGEPPYLGKSFAELSRQHCQAPIPTPQGLPDGLAQLLRAMLAKRREDRPQHHHEVVERLQALGATIDLRQSAQRWFVAETIDHQRLIRSLPSLAPAAVKQRKATTDPKGRQVRWLDEPIVIIVIPPKD